MPLTHERTFRVRHYECDAYGHVNNSQYVRYMQETAFDASAAGGYDRARYQALGGHWLIRETEVEYLAPLRFGDSVVVRTWVEDFRRVRSRRAYALRHAATGAAVARGWTDWVYLDSATGQPARIPPDLIAAFFPEGAPPQAAPRPRAPEPPPPPPGVFSMRRKVLWQDLDPEGHVNNAQYLGYASDAGFEVAAARGWPPDRMQAAGFGTVVRRMHVEYLQPAVLGDELDVETWWHSRRHVSARRAFRIRRASDGALLARLHGYYAWVNLETGQPVAIPAEFLEAFASNMAAA